ncbi:MAG: transporter [Bacteroidia bacterium]|nr:transporter [Bacteroidia bacterium]
MMKKFTFLLATLLFVTEWLQAQTPLDAIMMKQRESCFALVYDEGKFDQYWEGKNLRTNATIATVNRQTVLPLMAIGVHNKVNLIVAVPYVKSFSSELNGGKFAGAKGFQDLNLALKGEIVNKQVGKGKLAALATIGYSTPITNYLSDYRPYSIGFGANEVSLRGIVQYKLAMGIYVRGAMAYLWRGQTQIERDYYYNNGSYYTTWMDVPNAWSYNGVVGIRTLKNSLLLEANISGLNSTSGDDIRKYNAAQPTNKVDSEQLGFQAQYYFNKVKGLGLLTYYYQVINGRNVGKVSGFGIGGTYVFKI